MTEQLKKKVERAIRLLQSYKGIEPIEVSYSGGKDSDVILELVKMSGIPYRAIYKNTTIDPVGTVKHCKEMGAEVANPKETFFHIIEKHGFPTRFRRFCCEHLKEYKILDNAVQGVRREESTRRAARYKEPIVCRVYRGVRMSMLTYSYPSSNGLRKMCGSSLRNAVSNATLSTTTRKAASIPSADLAACVAR